MYAANGLKSDFGGHDHTWIGNLLLYVGNCYGAGFAKFMWGWPGYNDAFVNNTCVFRSTYASDCGRDASFDIRANRVYSNNGTLRVCGGKYSFGEWQSQGHDTESSLGVWPADGALIEQAKALRRLVAMLRNPGERCGDQTATREACLAAWRLPADTPPVVEHPDIETFYLHEVGADDMPRAVEAQPVRRTDFDP